MYLALVMIVWILFAYRFIDWSQWRKQYPTVLFFIAINLTYNMLYFNHTLWAFRGITAEWLNHSIINLAFTFLLHLWLWSFICGATLNIKNRDTYTLLYGLAFLRLFNHCLPTKECMCTITAGTAGIIFGWISLYLLYCESTIEDRRLPCWFPASLRWYSIYYSLFHWTA